MPDYEFVPKAELKKLEEEVVALRAHPILQDDDAKKLHAHMQALHHSMERMLGVFQKASSDMELEEREDQLMQRHLDPLHKALDGLSTQDETIAEGIVSVQDRLDGFQDRIEKLEKQVGEAVSTLSAIEEYMKDHKETKIEETQTTEFTTFAPPAQSPVGIQQSMPPPAMAPPMGAGVPPPGPMQNLPPPPGATVQQNKIPPLEQNALGKKKKKRSLFG